jgi:hypothetical protein
MVNKNTVGTANHRLSICKKCEFYSSTGTCGTPVIGDLVTINDVQYQTCGCKMSAKVLFPALSCPIGKWDAVIKLSDTTKEKLKIFLGGLNPFRISGEQLKELYSFASEVNDKHTPVTTCPECVQSVISDLKNMVRADDRVVEYSTEQENAQVNVENLVKEKVKRKRK